MNVLYIAVGIILAVLVFLVFLTATKRSNEHLEYDRYFEDDDENSAMPGYDLSNNSFHGSTLYM
jgi:hypothetical protein